MSVPITLSGKDCYINGVTGIVEITINEDAPVATFNHAGVPGGMQAEIGWSTFSWDANGLGYEPGLFPSATAVSKTFTYYYTVSDKLSWQGSLLCGNFTLTGDYANKQNPFTWSTSGLFSGSLSKLTTGNQDAGGYAAAAGANLQVLIDEAQVDNLQKVTLNVTRNLNNHPDLGTVFPGNLTATISIDTKLVDLSAPEFDSSLHDIKIVVNDAGEFWLLQSVKWNSKKGPKANRSGEAVGTTLTGVWSACDASGGASDLVSPGGTYHYGSA